MIAFLHRRESRSFTLISSESEELNRVLILTLARAMHVTGTESSGVGWTREFLASIKNNTPHAWSPHTLAAFPLALQDYYQVGGNDRRFVTYGHCEILYARPPKLSVTSVSDFQSFSVTRS